MTENGTPQGSVTSPLLFKIMINDVFERVDKSIHRFVFADDGAQWFRGGNIEYVVQNMQGALNVVEDLVISVWVQNICEKKTKVFLFTNKRKGADTKFII